MIDNAGKATLRKFYHNREIQSLRQANAAKIERVISDILGRSVKFDGRMMEREQMASLRSSSTAKICGVSVEAVRDVLNEKLSAIGTAVIIWFEEYFYCGRMEFRSEEIALCPTIAKSVNDSLCIELVPKYLVVDYYLDPMVSACERFSLFANFELSDAFSGP